LHDGRNRDTAALTGAVKKETRAVSGVAEFVVGIAATGVKGKMADVGQDLPGAGR
jgi:hypothetical protein